MPSPHNDVYREDGGLDPVLKRLYATTDAKVWAAEWCKVARKIAASGAPIIDEGWMIGWFANAIENAKDHERRRWVADDR
jgi:hypothetical protein